MSPDSASRPTWAEVDLKALVRNYRLLEGLLQTGESTGAWGPGPGDWKSRELPPELATPPDVPPARPYFPQPTTGNRQLATRNQHLAFVRPSPVSRPRLIPVVKANAYGHGAVAVAKALADVGATIFAVAIVEEGVELREAGITQDILILEGAWPGQEEAAVRHRLIPAVWSVEGVDRLAEAADRCRDWKGAGGRQSCPDASDSRRVLHSGTGPLVSTRGTDTRGTDGLVAPPTQGELRESSFRSVDSEPSSTAAGPPRIPVHLKVDTGMARLGVRWDSLDPLLRALAAAPDLELTGTFTHFASADEAGSAYTAEQLSRFDSALSRMRCAGIDPGEIHVSNSAGLLYHPQTRGCSARPGIALYGYPPDAGRCRLPLKPALSIKSRIGRVHRLNAGESIGYNRRFVAERPTVAATVPIGYADGYRRGMSGKASVLVRGRLAQVLGTVSMDTIVIDITDAPDAVEGDEVVLLGPHDSLTAEDWAKELGTISYEVLCGLSPRVPRRYSHRFPIVR